jgi:hypothetical protein
MPHREPDTFVTVCPWAAFLPDFTKNPPGVSHFAGLSVVGW